MRQQQGIASGAIIPVPLTISGLQTWLDGSDPGPNKGTVWEDKSGSGRGNWSKHASYNMPPLDHPTYELGAAYFANSHVISGPSYADMTAGEIFVRIKNASTQNNGLWYFSNKSDNGDWYPYGTSVYLGWGSTVRPGSPATGFTFTAYHTLNIWSAPNDWSISLNGVVKNTMGTSTVNFVSAPYIGKMAAASYFLHGYIKSICIFNRKLTTEERALMNAYMDSL